MDVLRLPPPLRRALLSHPSALPRTLTTLTTPTPSHHVSPPPTPPPPSSLSSYTTLAPPQPHQSKFAATFFTTSDPTILYTSHVFRDLPPSNSPEVAFLGRSNVGKSSLLNALFNRPHAPAAHVSKRPGRTRTMNGFGVSGGLEWGKAPGAGERAVRWRRFPRGGIVVVDMPGYGSGSREEWGAEVMKYLSQRTQLRRCFVLVDAQHGLKGSDVQLLTHLRRAGVGFSLVLSKVDKVVWSGNRAPRAEKLASKRVEVQRLCEEIRRTLDAEAGDGRKGQVDILACSAERSLDGLGRRIGVDEVRWAALRACGIECDESGRRKGVEGVLVREDVD